MKQVGKRILVRKKLKVTAKFHVAHAAQEEVW